MARTGAASSFPYINIVDEDGLSKIREGIFRILFSTGVTVQSEKMRKVLKEYGCIVDDALERVRFPKEVVKKAAADTAKKATLAGVDVAPGERISHPKFGEGTVIMVNGTVLTIVFDLYGTKKLAKDMAPLEKV